MIETISNTIQPGGSLAKLETYAKEGRLIPGVYTILMVIVLQQGKIT